MANGIGRTRGKAGLKLELTGVEEALARIAEIEGRSTKLAPAFRVIAGNLREKAEEQFRTQGAAGGARWKTLSPSTIRQRRRGTGYYSRGARGTRPLVASGGLMRSFTERSSSKHVEEVTNSRMEWGSKHPVAHLHVQGPKNRGPAPGLPKREIIAFRDESEEDSVVREPVRDHILSGLRR